MKAIFRLYLNTSKGNDSFLYRQLTQINIKPKYDQHLHAFYLDGPLPTLFHLCFHSLFAQNMWVQIGKPFPAVSEQNFPHHLEKIQFKNYLPLKRGLIQNMTLNILVRETKYPLSDRVITSFFQNCLQKEIMKKEYHQNIVKSFGGNAKDSLLSFYELRDIVQRKWEQEDILRYSNYNLLTDQSPKIKSLQGTVPTPSSPTPTPASTQVINSQQNNQQISESVRMQEVIGKQLANQLPYHPNLTFYVRKNQGRILLKINKQEMYKHGWKKQVGWAPIRQTIAAAALAHTKVLQQSGIIKIWDPFCGSATIPMVAAAQYYSLKIRGNIEQNFIWPHWSIFKNQYLQEYLKEHEEANRQKVGRLKLICSDSSFQAINYTINNLKELQKSMPKQQTDNQVYKNVKRLKPTDQIYELREGEWSVLCGDFQQVSKNVFSCEDKVNIITNLPYTQSRSKDHIPLNQLNSIYRRFNKMVEKNRGKIDNVFVVVNNSPSEIASPYHFLNISTQKWVQVASFQSGGLPIGLFAWKENALKPQFFDIQAVKNEIVQQKHSIQSITDEEKVHFALVKYRERIKQIQRRNYYVPQHLLKFKKGWKRVVQKRRKRHLLRAYELFARRRDKMIAFAEYSRKKLQVNMLRRGYIWRKRNMRLLQGVKIEDLEGELKKEFESRIEEALKKSQEKEAYRLSKVNEAKKEKLAKEEKKLRMKRQQYLGRQGKNKELLQERRKVGAIK